MCPVPAVDVDALKNTLSPTPGDAGEKVKFAVGAPELPPAEVTVTGFDALGAMTHQTAVTVAVKAGPKSEYAIDVPRVAPSTVASANLTWTFDGKGCAAASVERVTILVDPNPDGTGGTDAGTVACSTLGTDGAFVEPLSAGTHTFAILGLRTVGNAVHLLYRTHRPPASFFQAGLVTDVAVSAESPP